MMFKHSHDLEAGQIKRVGLSEAEIRQRQQERAVALAETESRQAAEQQQHADVAPAVQAIEILEELADEREQIAADLAALTGANATEMKNMVGRVLTILDHTLARQEGEVKALRHLAERFLG